MINIKYTGEQTPQFTIEIAPYHASMIKEAMILKKQYDSPVSLEEASHKLTQRNKLYKKYEEIGFLVVSIFIENNPTIDNNII